MSAAPLEKCVDETPVHSAPGVIPRPGFQNRRNRSQYLKNLYPAGFAVNNVRRELLVDQFPNRVGSPSQIHTGQPISFSFTGWARGGMEDSSSLGSMSFLEGDGDPFADCAGPTLRELTAMKSSGIKKSMDFYPEESSCLVSRCTLYSSAANRPKRLALVSPFFSLFPSSPTFSILILIVVASLASPLPPTASQVPCLPRTRLPPQSEPHSVQHTRPCCVRAVAAAEAK